MDAATLFVAVLANSAVNQVIVANQEKSVNAKIVDPSNLHHALALIKIAVKMTDAVKNKNVVNLAIVVRKDLIASAKIVLRIK